MKLANISLLVFISTGLHFNILISDVSSNNLYPIPNYPWEEVQYTADKILNPISFSGVKSSKLLAGKPVYVSMTSIDSRIDQVNITILQILNGSVVPDHIYLFISKDAYILDRGISLKSLPTALLELTNLYPVSIIFTRNIGPHRKLLPLLAKKWDEDCLIVTIDDEYKMGLEGYLFQLLKYYIAGKQSNIVALKVRRLGFCLDTEPLKMPKYKYWGEFRYGVREMLTLPTGTGSVLYSPKFFHPVVFNEEFRSLTSKTDDLTFRLSTLVNRVPVVIGCRNRYTKVNDTVTCHFVCPSRPTVKSRIPWITSHSDDLAPYRNYDYTPDRPDSHMDSAAAAEELARKVVGGRSIEAGGNGSMGRGRRRSEKNRKFGTQQKDSVAKHSQKRINGAGPASSGSMSASMSASMSGRRMEWLWDNEIAQSIRSSSSSSSSSATAESDHIYANTAADIRRRVLVATSPSNERTSLFSQFNRRDGNDLSWEAGLNFLRERGLLDLPGLAGKYLYMERESVCARNTTVKSNRLCMVYKCDKI